MTKNAKTLVIVGGGLAAVYYLYKNGMLGGVSGSAATPAEIAASQQATAAGIVSSGLSSGLPGFSS